MEIQKVTADEKIEADRGRVALRVGPLIYNVETADNGGDINRLIGKNAFNAGMEASILKWCDDDQRYLE